MYYTKSTINHWNLILQRQTGGYNFSIKGKKKKKFQLVKPGAQLSIICHTFPSMKGHESCLHWQNSPRYWSVHWQCPQTQSPCWLQMSVELSGRQESKSEPPPTEFKSQSQFLPLYWNEIKYHCKIFLDLDFYTLQNLRKTWHLKMMTITAEQRLNSQHIIKLKFRVEIPQPLLNVSTITESKESVSRTIF